MTAWRATLVAIAAGTCLAQAGDALRVRASICKDRRCNERTQVAFAPARIHVQVYVARDVKNRKLAYGVVCDGIPVAESRVDVDADYAPLYVATYRDVGAGECYAEAVVARADGSQRRARSEALIVRPALGQD